ncbi:peptide chain release factor 1 [Nocardioides hungaricus]
MFEAVEGMLAEHAELEQRLAAPETHADARLAKRLNQRYAALSSIIGAWRAWQRLDDDLEAAQELAAEDTEDSAFAEEAEALTARRHEAEERLRRLLVPRDPADDKDAILEVKSGEGGEESALFAGDLLRMYTRYAEARGWRVEVLDAAESDLGGYKSVTVAVKAKGAGHSGGAEPGEAPYALLKFEGGVHRVQRVPVTESQGRVHTSAAGVLVLPEAEQVDVQIDENDLRIDVFRSSGPGGQSVNTTDSAVRITHLPTGIVVSCQNEKSQLQNKEQALRILRSRLLQAAQDAAAAEAGAARRSQVRTVDRSERIRTYNFPENRISDHRTGYKAYNLDQVLDGDLQPVLDSCVDADLAARLETLE